MAAPSTRSTWLYSVPGILGVALAVGAGGFAWQSIGTSTTGDTPSSSSTSEPMPLGEPVDAVPTYEARFNDAQAVAAPPVDGAWDNQGWLFVANEVGRGVSVYDIATQEPVAWIYSPDAPVPHHPYISPDQRWVITNARFGSQSLVIDTVDDFATTYLEFPAGPEGGPAGPLHGIWTSDSSTFLVALQQSGRLGAIDVTGEPEVAEVVDVGARPRDVLLMPDDSKAFVTMQRENTVAVADLATWDVRQIERSATDYSERGSGSGGGMSSDGSLIAVANTLDDEVIVIDTATEEVVHRIADVPVPVNVEFLGTTHVIATGNRSDGTFTFIDGDSGELLATVETGGGANIASLGPDGNIWLSHNGAQHISVLDFETFEVVDEITVGLNPHWIMFDPNGSRAFVSNWGADTVSFVDTVNREELGKIPTGLNPNGMAVKSNVTEEQAVAALERARAAGVGDQIALTREMVLPEPRDEDERLFMNTCTVCHDLGRIVRNNAQGDQWHDIVERMRGNGAQMTDAEMEQIVEYLQSGSHQDLEFGTRYDEQYGQDAEGLAD
jgi:YVTN family beta-propeller protein